MPITLYESDGGEKKAEKPETSIVEGVVVDSCDLTRQGKVLVRIPSLEQEVWARLAAPGGGSGAGLYYNPRVDDEVLVALNGKNPTNSYILGGMWNTQDTPPVSNPVELTTKRVIKTGLKGTPGHQIEFDDGPAQSITIQTTTQQKIVMDPFKIELSNKTGTLTITMDNKAQKITIKAVDIELSAVKGITLKAPTIDVGDSTTGHTTIKGLKVDIN